MRIVSFLATGLFLLHFSSCESLHFGPTDNCKSFLKEFQHNWEFDTESRLFSPRSAAESLVKHQTCLAGWSQVKVWQLLGTPSFKTETVTRYFFSETCFLGEGGPYLQVNYDAEGEVRDILWIEAAP